MDRKKTVRYVLCYSFFSTCLLVSFCYMGFASAAVQGLLGKKSTGTVTISLNIPSMVRVSGVNDVDFRGIIFGRDINHIDDLCVFHNGNGYYRVTIYGSGKLGSFSFAGSSASAANTRIPFTVSWGDSMQASKLKDVLSNVALRGLYSNERRYINCQTMNSQIKINVSDKDIIRAKAGIYIATLFIIVATE